MERTMGKHAAIQEETVAHVNRGKHKETHFNRKRERKKENDREELKAQREHKEVRHCIHFETNEKQRGTR